MLKYLHKNICEGVTTKGVNWGQIGLVVEGSVACVTVGGIIGYQLGKKDGEIKQLEQFVQYLKETNKELAAENKKLWEEKAGKDENERQKNIDPDTNTKFEDENEEFGKKVASDENERQKLVGENQQLLKDATKKLEGENKQLREKAALDENERQKLVDQIQQLLENIKKVEADNKQLRREAENDKTKIQKLEDDNKLLRKDIEELKKDFKEFKELNISRQEAVEIDKNILYRKNI